MVRGTNTISETSLVTNMEEKNTPNTKKSESPAIVPMRPVRRRSGRNTFSCLNPSKTVSIINSVPSVRQSMAESNAFDGGVINKESAAASSATGSMGSFLM